MDTVRPLCRLKEYGCQKCVHHLLYVGFNVVIICTKCNNFLKVFWMENFIKFTDEIGHFVNWHGRKIQFCFEHISSKINRQNSFIWNLDEISHNRQCFIIPILIFKSSDSRQISHVINLEIKKYIVHDASRGSN